MSHPVLGALMAFGGVIVGAAIVTVAATWFELRRRRYDR